MSQSGSNEKEVLFRPGPLRVGALGQSCRWPPLSPLGRMPTWKRGQGRESWSQYTEKQIPKDINARSRASGAWSYLEPAVPGADACFLHRLVCLVFLLPAIRSHFNSFYPPMPTWDLVIHSNCSSSKPPTQDFPGCPVVENPPANAGDAGSIAGPERCCVPWRKWARGPQPEPVLWSPCSATREATAVRTCAAHCRAPPAIGGSLCGLQ